MRMLCSLLLLMCAVPASARKHYCDVVLHKDGLFSPAVTIAIRTGEEPALYRYITDQDASFLHRTFRQPIDVVNFMARNGWDLSAVDGVVKNGDETHMYFWKDIADDTLQAAASTLPEGMESRAARRSR